MTWMKHLPKLPGIIIRPILLLFILILNLTARGQAKLSATTVKVVLKVIKINKLTDHIIPDSGGDKGRRDPSSSSRSELPGRYPGSLLYPSG
jgi:hypothetical protein